MHGRAYKWASTGGKSICVSANVSQYMRVRLKILFIQVAVGLQSCREDDLIKILFGSQIPFNFTGQARDLKQ